MLAGDLALVGATHAIALCGADPETHRGDCSTCSTDAVHASAAGELADVALSIARDGTSARWPT